MSEELEVIEEYIFHHPQNSNTPTKYFKSLISTSMPVQPPPKRPQVEKPKSSLIDSDEEAEEVIDFNIP